VLSHSFSTPGPGTWLSQANGLLPGATGAIDIHGRYARLSHAFFRAGFQAGARPQNRLKPLFALMMGVTFVSFVVGIWTAVKLGYRDGGGLTFHSFYATIGPQIPAWNTDGLRSGSQNVSWLHSIWLVMGALLTYGLMLARSRFAGFPFHPSDCLRVLHPPFMWCGSRCCGLAVQSARTKFGGIDSYRKIVPAALALFWARSRCFCCGY
jgi:hypothetical protein